LQVDRGTEGNRKKNAAYRTKMARNNDSLSLLFHTFAR